MVQISKKSFVAFAIVICLCFAWTDCRANSPYTWRYKLIVKVETPEGLKTGEAVRKVSIIPSLNLTPEMGPTTRMHGEAVIVDLGERGVLFALLSTTSYREVFEAFPNEGPSTTVAGLKFYSNLKPGPVVSIKNTIPRMVTFDRLADPLSAKNVDPNNLAASFGNGVNLKDVSVQIVDGPIVWKIKSYLPWIDEYYSKRLDGNRFGTSQSTYKVANSLSSGAFRAGEDR